MHDAVKLLPCPWCGPVGAVAVSPNFSKCGAGKPTWMVSCQNCQAKIYDELSTQEIAAQRWNTRAPTPREQELEAQNKALWELVDWSKIMLADSQQYMEVMGFDGKLIEFKNAYKRFVKAKGDWEAAIQKAKEAR